MMLTWSSGPRILLRLQVVDLGPRSAMHLAVVDGVHMASESANLQEVHDLWLLPPLVRGVTGHGRACIFNFGGDKKHSEIPSETDPGSQEIRRASEKWLTAFFHCSQVPRRSGARRRSG